VTERQDPSPDPRLGADDLPEIELRDADILDAMQHIPGYLDITTEDFRAVYRLAHRHAIERTLGGLRAGRLMRVGFTPLAPEMPLDTAARVLVASGFKGLPVVDGQGRALAMLTETDFLRHLRAETFLELLPRLLERPGEFAHRCHETPVSAAMTSPAVTVGPDAGYHEMLAAFRRHGGRSMPVVDDDAGLRGLLLRKDFLGAFDREAAP
jgi:CBS domain-containing membrane protein